MKLSLSPKTLLLPAPVLIIGTHGSDGKPNMMNAAWGRIAASMKVQPMIWGSFGSNAYFKTLDKLGDAFSVGKK